MKQLNIIISGHYIFLFLAANRALIDAPQGTTFSFFLPKHASTHET